MLALFMPIIQSIYPLIPQRDLKGAFTIPDKPELNAESWVSGAFQSEYSAWYEYQVGMRPFLIRLRNQLYYELFNKSTTFVRPGKGGQFFSWDYWSAFKGYDGVNLAQVEEQAKLLSWLNDSLLKKDKHLLCVIAPNKVRYMPENLPDQWDDEPGRETFYQFYKEALSEHGIPLLDLNKTYLEMKDTVLKPLFANTSTHWNGYGMHLGISMIIDSLEVLGQRNHLNLRYAEWVMMDSVIESDRDMVDLMNLLCEPPTEPQAFPVYDLDTTDDNEPVRILIIGDSFFWNFYSFDVRHQIFHPSTRFWYYGKTEFDLEGNKRGMEYLSAIAAINDVDYVVILATESNLPQFPYGFPDKYLSEVSSSKQVVTE